MNPTVWYFIRKVFLCTRYHKDGKRQTVRASVWQTTERKEDRGKRKRFSVLELKSLTGVIQISHPLLPRPSGWALPENLCLLSPFLWAHRFLWSSLGQSDTPETRNTGAQQVQRNEHSPRFLSDTQHVPDVSTATVLQCKNEDRAQGSRQGSSLASLFSVHTQALRQALTSPSEVVSGLHSHQVKWLEEESVALLILQFSARIYSLARAPLFIHIRRRKSSLKAYLEITCEVLKRLENFRMSDVSLRV